MVECEVWSLELRVRCVGLWLCPREGWIRGGRSGLGEGMKEREEVKKRSETVGHFQEQREQKIRHQNPLLLPHAISFVYPSPKWLQFGVYYHEGNFYCWYHVL